MRWEGGRESGNVEDRRGMKPAVAAGGGVLTLVILVVAYFAGIDPNQARQIAKQFDQAGGGAAMQQVGPPPDPQTKKFAATVLGFTEDVWDDQFRKMGERYEKPGLVLFTDAVVTEGCGTAPSAVGPFYCPADKKLYLDPTFFEELEQKLGGSKAEFSQAYVIAHEVGHHVQNLLGYNRLVKQFEQREGKNGTIRLELQADYLAGVWANHAQQKFNILERGDIESAITTATAIGDDRIQKKSAGWVSPESFTHGSAAQRVKWFNAGLRSGDASKKALDQFFDPRVNPLEL